MQETVAAEINSVHSIVQCHIIQVAQHVKNDGAFTNVNEIQLENYCVFKILFKGKNKKKRWISYLISYLYTAMGISIFS